MRAGWIVVIPVKEATRGKTRLAAVLDPRVRAALVRAMALDTIEAVTSATTVTRVIVVSGDPVVAERAGSLRGVRVLAEPAAEVGDRGWDALNRAVLAGISAARGEAPTAQVAVLLGDLPGLDPAEVDAALAAAGDHERAVVADAQGTGTTLLTWGPGVPAEPRFGTGSAAAHLAVGHVPLGLPLPTVRQDVDLPADLRRLTDRGVGGRTGALLARLAPLPLP